MKKCMGIDKMKIFITGVCGQLGYDLAREGLKRGMEVYGTDLSGEVPLEEIHYQVLDIRDKEKIEEVLLSIKPDIVFHSAAWTAVDDAEEEANKENVYQVNEEGTAYLAEICSKIEAKIIYLSTDYVFSGEGTSPWKVDSKDFSPLNIYGDSKLKGETAVSNFSDKFFIVRIAWVFGVQGNNFIKTMLRVGKKYEEVRVVMDQIGRPTYTYDLASLLYEMAETEEYGYYHITNEGDYISWYDFTCEIYNQAGLDTKVTPVTTEEYGVSKAKRPSNSRLDTSKLLEKGFKPLPEWKDALARYLKEID